MVKMSLNYLRVKYSGNSSRGASASSPGHVPLGSKSNSSCSSKYLNDVSRKLLSLCAVNGDKRSTIIYVICVIYFMTSFSFILDKVYLYTDISDTDNIDES